MKTIIATLPVTPVSNARQLDKEVIHQYHVIGLFNGVMASCVDCRIYMSRSGDGASPVHCALGVMDGPAVHETSSGNQVSFNYHTSGKGRANGYGYHKSSAAVADAIESAGIKLNSDISGMGDEAIKDALAAIGMACGASQVVVVG